jgi:hypothetical protein
MNSSLRFLIVSSCLFLACAAAQVYPQNPLFYQILKPRKGFDGKLTNRACLEYKGQTCKNEQIVSYDLADKGFRDRANGLKFVCNVAGKRFKLCLDKPGLCRMTSHQDCFLFICGDKTWTEEFLAASDYQFLLDSDVQCFNEDVYPFVGAK